MKRKMTCFARGAKCVSGRRVSATAKRLVSPASASIPKSMLERFRKPRRVRTGASQPGQSGLMERLRVGEDLRDIDELLQIEYRVGHVLPDGLTFHQRACVRATKFGGALREFHEACGF